MYLENSTQEKIGVESVAPLWMTAPREVILRELALMGYPINEMADEQIEQLVKGFERFLVSHGFTMEQVRYVLRELNPTPDT